MNNVIDRLEALAVNGAGGDWRDVLGRAERQRSASRRRLLIAVAAALVLAVPALALAYRLTERLVVSSTEAEPPVAWIGGNRFFDPEKGERTLAEPLGRSTGYFSFYFDSSPAIPSPEGDALIYATTEGSPNYRLRRWVLRFHDLTSGLDRILEDGAPSAAWRGDGALGYVAGVPGPWETIDAIVGHVYVRRSLSEPPVRWSTRPAEYVAIAWARDRLLVGALAAGERSPPEGVYAFSGPGRARKLPIGQVLAVDPRGDLVVGPVSQEPLLAGSLTFRIVRVRDGAVLDEVDLAPIIDPTMPYDASNFVSGGSWAGDYIVLGASGSVENALVVLRFSDGRLSPAHVFRLEASSAARAGLATPPWLGFGEPRFIDEEGDEIVAWATTTRKDGRKTVISSVFLVCSRIDKECSRTDALPGTAYSLYSRTLDLPARAFVENPSRPLPD
jgi:hypothetical protein